MGLDPSPTRLDLLACHKNLCELECGIRFFPLWCKFKCGIAAKALKIWVKNRGPRTANTTLLGHCWSLKQHSLKSCNRTAFTEEKKCQLSEGQKTSKQTGEDAYLKLGAQNPPAIFGQPIGNNWRLRPRHSWENQHFITGYALRGEPFERTRSS